MFHRLFHHPGTATENAASGSRLGYIPALDGLRALAVIAVLFYHADMLWMSGGFLGVEIFFVVSGYLITSLLLAEFRENGSVQLKKFWQRRARRLLPALFAMILAVMAYAVIFLPGEVAALKGDVLAAFTYITNWYLIAEQKSYFESIGRPSVLQHLWSLAVEEQFYLLWPLIFVFLLVKLKSRLALILLMLGAMASALWMGYLYQPDTDPSRIYYGTDTRAAGLLLGAALAFVTQVSLASKSQWRRWVRDIIGIAALVGLVAACIWVSEFDPLLYQGGMFLVGAATALVIAAVIAPNSPILGPILSIGILRWIGLRSYGLYLWHWPVFMLTRPGLDVALDGTPLLLVRLGITFALAEISYQLIETPIRKGGLGKAWDGWTRSNGVRRWGLGAAWMGAAALATFGLLFLGNAIVTAQPAEQPDLVLAVPTDVPVLPVQDQVIPQPEQVTQPQVAATEDDTVASSDLSPVSYVIFDDNDPTTELPTPYAMDSWLRAYIATRLPLTNELQAESEAWRLRRVEPSIAAPNKTACDSTCVAQQEFLQLKDGVIRPAAPAGRSVASSTVQPILPTNVNAAPADVPMPPSTGTVQVLAIGDSVMLGASNYLRKSIVDVDVDAQIGRQVSMAIRILQERKDANMLPPTVIIHLGNNGIFSTRQFDEMMTVLKDVPRVIFINTKVPRKWEEPNNTALVDGVKRYPNATLIDWNNASVTHADWFWTDGIHLRPEGAQVYANLIAQVINQTPSYASQMP